MVEKSTKELKSIFSQYNDRDAQSTSKNTISLEKWIKDKITATENEKDPDKKWETSNIFKKLYNIVSKSSLKDDAKKELLNYIKELFYPANVKDLNYFYKDIDIKSTTSDTDYDYITKIILNYKNENYNLASNSKTIE
jgi:hypothetical protein